LSECLPAEEAGYRQVLFLIRPHNYVSTSIAVPTVFHTQVQDLVSAETLTLKQQLRYDVRRLKHKLTNSCVVFLRSHMRMTSLKTGYSDSQVSWFTLSTSREMSAYYNQRELNQVLPINCVMVEVK
jgi:hypothetical protein